MLCIAMFLVRFIKSEFSQALQFSFILYLKKEGRRSPLRTRLCGIPDISDPKQLSSEVKLCRFGPKRSPLIVRANN